jgi:hypothetical protein
VVCFLCSIRALLGYASFRQGGSIGELVDSGQYEECCYLENGPSLYFMVHLEGKEITDVSRTRPKTRDELLHLFLVTLYSWTTGWLAPRAISFVDFLSLFSFSP